MIIFFLSFFSNLFIMYDIDVINVPTSRSIAENYMDVNVSELAEMQFIRLSCAIYLLVVGLTLE